MFEVINNGMNIKQAQVYLKETAKIGREERKRIYQLLGLTTVTNGQTKANIGLTASLKTLTSGILKMAAAWATSPFGIATIAVAGFYAITAAVKYFSEELDRSRDKLSELKNEYGSNESELKSLNDELNTTRDRVRELQALKDSGAISFAEQEELDRLNSQNVALQRKIDLLKIEQELKRSDINKQFVKTGDLDMNNPEEYLANSKLASQNYIPKNASAHAPSGTVVFTTMSEQDYINSVLMRRAEIVEQLSTELTDKEEQELNGLLTDIDKFLVEEINKLQTDLNSVSFIKGATTEDQKAANEMILMYEDMLDRIAISIGKESSRTNAFNRLVDTEFDDVTKGLKELGKEGAVTAEMLKDPAYSEFVDKCINLGVVSDASTESLNFLALGFNNITNAASGSGAGLSGTTTAIDLINQSIDGVQSKISSLGDSFAKLRDGSLTLEEVIDLIQEFPELAEYVDLTSESFGDLDKGLQKLIRHAPDKLIDELQDFKKTADLTDKQREAIDDLCTSMEKLSTDAITDASEEFGILAEAINASKRAKSELDKALAEDDYDANYEDRLEAFEKLKEVLKSGEIGSKAYQAITKYLGIDGLDSSGVKKFVQDNNKYFDEGKKGIEAWLREVERLNKAGVLDKSVASYDSVTKRFSYDYTKLEELADAFNWNAPEMAQNMIGKFRMYSEDYIDYTTEMIQKELLMKDVIQDFGSISVVSMEQVQEYTGYTAQGVSDLVAQINALNQAAADNELTKLAEGGNVNLKLRPQIDVSELLSSGWTEEMAGQAGEIATVFTHTFNTAAGDLAINVTPIMADSSGKLINELSSEALSQYINNVSSGVHSDFLNLKVGMEFVNEHGGILSPEAIEEYANGVLSGVHDDYLKLQIGAEYTGKDAVDQAIADRERIHQIHETYFSDQGLKILGVDDIHITQQMIDAMDATIEKADDVKAKLVELSQYEGVTFEPGAMYFDQTIEEILAEAKAKTDDAVTVDVKMSVNDQEIIASITNTAAEFERILGPGWNIILESGDAEEKMGVVLELMEEASEKVTVTAEGRVHNAVSDIGLLIDELRTAHSLSKISISASYTTSGKKYTSPGSSAHDTSAFWDSQHAAGTRHAKAGAALLGDEYSPDGSPKPELVVQDGTAFIAGQSGPEIVDLSSGAQVYTANETSRILHGSSIVRKSTIPAYAGGKKKELFDNLAASGASSEEVSTAMRDVSIKSGANLIIYTDGNSGGTFGSGGYSGGGSGSGSNSSDSSDSSKKEKSQFEKDYEAHNHLVAMEKESYEDYLKWLEGAYEDAYNKGEIELEDYRKYMEEVFNGQKELFQDSIEDIEHKINALEREPGSERQIINYYNKIIAKIDEEIAAARARGLNDDDDYIQELLEQKWDYADEIADIEEEITENAKDSIDELVDYRVDMLKQEIEDQKDALDDKLDTLRDFYDKQKEMLQDAYDEEKYLEEQDEKRRSVSDIKDELEELRFDTSAAAEKRKLELQEELKAAEKELRDFEKDKALQDAMDLLDKQYEQQESEIQSQIDELDARLNDPNALYNQALSDIKHNTSELYEEMVAYNNAHGDGNPETIKEMYDSAKKSLDDFLRTFGQAYKDILLVESPGQPPSGYASGTDNATRGIHELFEGNKDEYVYQTKDGHRYKMFSGLGDKVLNASATEFLYKFANNGEAFLSGVIKSLIGNVSNTNISKSVIPVQLTTGDIIIQGNASERTVSEIRRVQRESMDYVLREFAKYNR